MLILRTCNEDMTAYGGFAWPREIGAEVVAPDWNPEPVCGGGLHGLAWGIGDAGLMNLIDPTAVGVVFEAAEDCVVDLGQKVKCSRGVIRFVGSLVDAAVFIDENKPVKNIAGYRGTATAGYGGTATAGDGGTATAGDGGTATAGDGGTATAGDGGTATAGYRGTATAGYGGTATAGDGGTATADYGGTATAGYGGTATAGDGGTATAGYRGTATAGYRGTATAGYGGTATAGYGGTATAGDGGIIILLDADYARHCKKITKKFAGKAFILVNNKFVLKEQK